MLLFYFSINCVLKITKLFEQHFECHVILFDKFYLKIRSALLHTSVSLSLFGCHKYSYKPKTLEGNMRQIHNCILEAMKLCLDVNMAMTEPKQVRLCSTFRQAV